MPKDRFYRLFQLPNVFDTPIQRLVSRPGCCSPSSCTRDRCSPSTTSAFGFCGAVSEGIEFASDEFWAQWKAVDIDAWVESILS